MMIFSFFKRDDDLLDFFVRCKLALKPNGVCVLKENIAKKKEELDFLDNSITRPRKLYVQLIKKAGMKVIKEEKQRGFPDELYAVWLMLFK